LKNPNCGFQAFCGRPAHHRGHHGGWRTRVAAVAKQPVVYRDDDGVKLGTELGPQELRVVAELVIHGGQKQVAECLGLSYHSVRSHVSKIISKTGADSSYQLPYILGWINLPQGTYHVDEEKQ